MPKDEIVRGATSQIFELFVQNAGATNGAGLTGLVFNSASLTAYYKTDNGTAATAITLANITTIGTFANNGFREVDSTNMPGVYEFDPPNAAFSNATANRVVFMLKGATNMAPVLFEVAMKAVNTQDSVRGGMTALPNANAEASGGLYTRGVGAGQITQSTNGQIDVDVKKINSVVTSSVTTVNANVGQTQPVNFTGTGGSALVKTDMVDVAGAAVSTSVAQIGVNAVNIGGTAQTGRDIGASVLLSSGTGTGQLDFTSGVVKSNLAQILGTALTETAGLLAGGFKKFFNVATPTGTLNSIPDAVAGASGGLSIVGSAMALSAGAVQAIWDALTSALTTAGSIGKLLVDNINATISSRSSHSAGDVWAVGTRVLTAGTNIVLAKGVGVTGFNDVSTAQVNTEVDTALADINLDHLVKIAVDTDFATTVHLDSVVGQLADNGTSATFDRTTDSLEALAGASAPSAAAIADAVWEEAIADHSGTAGSTAAALAAAGSAGDPWATALPGLYASGSAGKIVGDNLNATVSSRLASASISLSGGAVTVGTNNDKTGYALSAAGVQAIWDALTSALTTVNSIGKRLADDINATISSRSSHTAADVWAAATRTLTSGLNIVLAKGVGVTGFNDLSAAQVNAEVDTGLADYDGPTHAEMTAAINALNDIASGTAMTLTSGERTAIANALLDLANGIEAGLTLRQAQRLQSASAAGKLSGAATTEVTIRNAVADSKDRIVATVDADGNRSAVTVDVS